MVFKVVNSQNSKNRRVLNQTMNKQQNCLNVKTSEGFTTKVL